MNIGVFRPRKRELRRNLRLTAADFEGLIGVMSSSVDTLVTVLPAWRRSLRADNRRETTIASYELAPNQLHAYLEKEGFPAAVAKITTDAIRGFGGSVLEKRSSSTASASHLATELAYNWS